MTSSDLYEDDILLWSERQAELLRRRASGQSHVAGAATAMDNNFGEEAIDWDNVAEEIASVGRSERSRLASYISTVLEHLMRLQASPATEPRRGWRATVGRARIGIAKVLAENPSLAPTVPAVVAAEMPTARELAALGLEEYGETPSVSLEQLSYTPEQVTGRWLPED